ncbi:MAG: ferrous iron transport protein A [Clostridiales bacterium]|nr:ferrous iron transport protein A [Clostridiales bacterium]
MSTLKDLKPGEKGIIKSLGEKGPARRRLMDMGLTPGIELEVVKVAPLGDPIEVNIRGYELSLRKDEANQITLR